ncbi:hypothetical protein SAMN04487970_104059 [Paenibacillus tianmuensis]|uniref:Uncharacterized protein n=1 Tax=Paenibacillus tianmuensis TaxID=624147 RepID=A0A1G4T4K6_9BACL|nr:hypothetical protein SAMN04487970_104059 [Paenibacillus tianmuensis]
MYGEPNFSLVFRRHRWLLSSALSVTVSFFYHSKKAHYSRSRWAIFKIFAGMLNPCLQSDRGPRMGKSTIHRRVTLTAYSTYNL